VGDLPDEALMYLLGSRYCDTQKLSDQAWAMFGGVPGQNVAIAVVKLFNTNGGPAGVRRTDAAGFTQISAARSRRPSVRQSVPGPAGGSA
jgi:hypothetical protein